MKTLLLLLLIASAALPQERVTALIDQVAQKEYMKNWEVVVENSNRWMDSPEGKELGQLAPKTWKEMVIVFKRKGDDVRKAILAVSYRELSPVEYVDFLNVLAGYAKDGTVPKRLLAYCLFSNGNKRAILVDNYRDARVISAVHNLREAVKDDERLDEALRGVLSGEAKKGMDGLREVEDIETVYLSGSPNASEKPVKSRYARIDESNSVALRFWGIGAAGVLALLSAGAFVWKFRRAR